MQKNQRQIRKRLSEIQRDYPNPDWDTNRYPNRRWVLEHADKGGIGLEVGVFRGRFAELICEITQPRKLYLVDPWTLLGETFGWGKEYTNFGKLPTAIAREETELRIAQFPGVQPVIIEDHFPRCSTQITEILDWAYIDASHQYEATLFELKTLLPMIKPGGTIMGDDWNNDPEHVHHGVYLAVNEFVENSDCTLLEAGRGGQWAIRVPG